MNIEQFKYTVIKLVNRIRLDAEEIEVKINNNYSREYTVELIKEFAVGSQIRIETDNNTKKSYLVSIPLNGINYLKKIVIEFCPEINFGWLQPAYKKVYGKVVNNYTYTCYNVYPLSKNEKNRDNTFRLTTANWLNSDPFTPRELDAAYTRIDELDYNYRFSNGGYKTIINYTPVQLAKISVYESLKQKENNNEQY